MILLFRIDIHIATGSISVKEKILFYSVDQRGPITFDPRATLQEHDDLRATSNKMSQDQKSNKKRFSFTSFLYKEQIHKI